MEVNSPLLDRVKIAVGMKKSAGRDSRKNRIQGMKKLFLLYPQQRQKEANSRKDSWNLRRSHMNK